MHNSMIVFHRPYLARDAIFVAEAMFEVGDVTQKRDDGVCFVKGAVGFLRDGRPAGFCGVGEDAGAEVEL